MTKKAYLVFMLAMRKITPKLLKASSLFLLMVATSPTASSQTPETSWSDPTLNNYWNVAENWTGGLPDSTKNVQITGAGGTIFLNADATSAFNRLRFSSSDSTYTLASDSTTIRKLHAPASSGGFQAAHEANNSSLTIRGIDLTANAGSSFAYNGSGNSLLISGTGTRLAVAYNAGLSLGGGDGSIAANSSNTITVDTGALLTAGLFSIGSKGGQNSLVVTGSGTQLTAVGTAAGFGIRIGSSASGDENSLKILNGAVATVTRQTTVVASGSLVIGKGSSLIHSSAVVTDNQTFGITSKGTLFGAGTLKAKTLLLSGATQGGKVYVGENQTDIGQLDFTGNWENAGITIHLGIGDLSTAATAGENFDFLNIDGDFKFGGSINIDLAGALYGSATEVQLIHWTTSSGTLGDLTVNFTNGPIQSYEIRENGLYITSIPEPSSVALIGLSLCGTFILLRSQRKA